MTNLPGKAEEQKENHEKWQAPKNEWNPASEWTTVSVARVTHPRTNGHVHGAG